MGHQVLRLYHLLDREGLSAPRWTEYTQAQRTLRTVHLAVGIDPGAKRAHGLVFLLAEQRQVADAPRAYFARHQDIEPFTHDSPCQLRIVQPWVCVHSRASFPAQRRSS